MIAESLKLDKYQSYKFTERLLSLTSLIQQDPNYFETHIQIRR